jgi:hypothetical protein
MNIIVNRARLKDSIILYYIRENKLTEEGNDPLWMTREAGPAIV